MGEQLVEAVRAGAALTVRDPVGGLDVVEAGLVQGLAARDGLVQFALAVPRERAQEMEPLRQAAEKAAAGVPGVLSATVVLTAHREPTGPKPGGAGAAAPAHAAPHPGSSARPAGRQGPQPARAPCCCPT